MTDEYSAPTPHEKLDELMRELREYPAVVPPCPVPVARPTWYPAQAPRTEAPPQVRWEPAQMPEYRWQGPG